MQLAPTLLRRRHTTPGEAEARREEEAQPSRAGWWRGARRTMARRQEEAAAAGAAAAEVLSACLPAAAAAGALHLLSVPPGSGGGGGGSFHVPPGGGGGGGGGAFTVPPGLRPAAAAAAAAARAASWRRWRRRRGRFSAAARRRWRERRGRFFRHASRRRPRGRRGRFRHASRRRRRRRRRWWWLGHTARRRWRRRRRWRWLQCPLFGGGAVPSSPRARADSSPRRVSASAAAFSSRASRPAFSSMAHANALRRVASSANETEDADANDVSEASDDASASVSDASVEISSKSATRASSSVGRRFAFVSPLGTETFVSAPLGSVEVSLRVTSGRLCFFAFWRLSRRVEARSLSPSGPSPSSFFIGLGGSLPLVGAPSASAPGDDSTSPASLFESPTLWSLSVLENGTKVSRRRLDEDRDGNDGPDADLLVRRSRRVRVGTVAESSSEEDAPIGDRGGAVTAAIAVAVGVSGCASRWRARRSATSPLPPNRGVKGPQKREENSSVSPLARASSSSSSLALRSQQEVPAERGVAARARGASWARSRACCVRLRESGGVRQRERVVRRRDV